MIMRKLIGKITSPIFVPLRKLVVWGDEQFGTCDHKLSVVPRKYKETLKPEIAVQPVSELEKKLSKDKANLNNYDGESKQLKPIGNQFPPKEVTKHLKSLNGDE